MGSKPPDILTRLVGLETEYALRFSPTDDGEHPGNEAVYEAIAASIREAVIVHLGERRLVRSQYFIQNGGAFYYESLPTSPDGGLLEASTPECRGPSQALLYQKANDELLREVLPAAERKLRRQGFDGELGLLKNCRDAEGNVYGAQENYEATIATGWRLALWRLFLIAWVPVVLLCTALTWLVLFFLIAWLAMGALLGSIVGAMSPSWLDADIADSLIVDNMGVFEAPLADVMMWVEVVIWWPVVRPTATALKRLTFSSMRDEAMAFILSRPIVSGCGTVDERGLFSLSEKGPATIMTNRDSVLPERRGVFDGGNLMKHALSMVHGEFRPYFGLMRRRQRLQLGLSDSNMAQMAEYLKLGTTLLVVDMAEAGALEGAPILLDPIKALHDICSDPTLQASVAVRDNGQTAYMTALALQRVYHERAALFVEARDGGAEAARVVRLWGEVLDALEEDPGRLVGKLDWVTKRYLLESCGAHAPYPVQKKIDLRYHELGAGYLAQLEAAGVAPVLVDPVNVAHARLNAPSNTPARLRAELMKTYQNADIPVHFSWGTVRIGGWLRGQRISIGEKH